jgi:hypothetical protein
MHAWQRLLMLPKQCLMVAWGMFCHFCVKIIKGLMMVEPLSTAVLGKRYTDATIREHHRFVGGSLMICTGITFNRRTQFYAINGNLNKVMSMSLFNKPYVYPWN